MSFDNRFNLLVQIDKFDSSSCVEICCQIVIGTEEGGGGWEIGELAMTIFKLWIQCTREIKKLEDNILYYWNWIFLNLNTRERCIYWSDVKGQL